MQSGNERILNKIISTVINHDHLILKKTDVAFEGLCWLHLDGEKVVDVLLKLLPGGVLVEEGIATLEASERS